MVGLSIIKKHQHCKKVTRWTVATWTKNTWKCKLFATVCSQKCSKCPPFERTYTLRRFLHWSTALSLMTCRKSGHTAIKHSFSSLRTLNEQKAKCWYFAWRYSLHLFSRHLTDTCWIDDKKSHMKHVLHAWEWKIYDFKFSKVMQQHT